MCPLPQDSAGSCTPGASLRGIFKQSPRSAPFPQDAACPSPRARPYLLEGERARREARSGHDVAPPLPRHGAAEPAPRGRGQGRHFLRHPGIQGWGARRGFVQGLINSRHRHRSYKERYLSLLVQTIQDA